jgi:hypothetical protein
MLSHTLDLSLKMRIGSAEQEGPFATDIPVTGIQSQRISADSDPFACDLARRLTQRAISSN